ncbi:hypothetical protein HYDPIDRAFT_42485 [Hydnomerulius pinastri MD-312]|uniref:Uncharacterized protein n=1 Tax=Hydnomerulius pinastri MD-312 TaxID=994086 RepID=A0A0C9W582_9AGAM|nr:hypothetical protein HYDPIDRAFT_42485 [Hydnomerulius pinastri MD-312]
MLNGATLQLCPIRKSACQGYQKKTLEAQPIPRNTTMEETLTEISQMRELYLKWVDLHPETTRNLLRFEESSFLIADGASGRENIVDLGEVTEGTFEFIDLLGVGEYDSNLRSFEDLARLVASEMNSIVPIVSFKGFSNDDWR